MSYILDALTKAAKQRGRQAPVLQRLLGPTSVTTSAGSRWSGRLIAAVLLNAILLTLLLAMWLRPVSVAAPPKSLAAPAPEVPREKTEPREREAVLQSRSTQRSAVTPTRPPAAPAPRRPPPTAQGTQAPTLAPPVTPVKPPAPSEPPGLKVEALIYAETPAQRTVFINGRKYVEGDSIDGRLRVEEIQEEGVVLSEEGRRFTLRVAR
jgi:type II secretion system (T2SS) protein B